MTNKFELLPSRIRKNKILSSKKIYIVQGEVRVLKNVRLIAREDVNIFLINGIFKESCLKRSTLIFDQGSQLTAKKLNIKAADESFKPVKFADNGGLWFLGNYADASKDGMAVKLNRKNPLSHFSAQAIAVSYLGRKDQYISPKSGKLIDIGDDVDAISVIGLGPNEWDIDAIKSHYSADDGLDLNNSHISLKRLDVKDPTEDGVNLSSSRLEIHGALILDVSKTTAADRDLVDIETNDGASYLELYRGCRVNLSGVFGDEIVLSSTEMPQPNTTADNEKSYRFEGRLKNAALIYSIDQD
ncbi:MAG: hypothetical protein ACOYN1_09300 [Polynucleobacter sp.]